VTTPVQRKIIHIDMDAFYASVEQRDDPSLRGKPVIVGGDPNSRAVVCAASYEARKFGVRSAISCAEAKRRCPQGIFIPPRFTAYREASDTVMSILQTVTDKIEPLSLDEAYLDVTTNLLNERSATRVAEYLRREIFAKTQLTASAGVSFNKFLAKIGSDLNKPNGMAVITPDKMEAILLPMSVDKLWGVGKKTFEKLKLEGILTVADVRKRSPEQLERVLGSMGQWLWDLSHGRDDREVESNWDRKSYGSERTFDQDILAISKLDKEVEELSEEISESLKEMGWYAMTFTLKIKYFDFKQVTRSSTLTIPTDSAEIIYQKMKKLLLDKTDAGKIPIRLVGVSASHFIREDDPLQLYFEFMDTL
jgi:DNA polymerase-4